MNIVILSPHFPPNYFLFAVRLREMGVNVLGLGDAEFYHLRPDLQRALTEYFRVENMQNYDDLVRALGFFTHRYGKIDRLDSFNEFWLETEANLRTDFNIFGVKSNAIQYMKRKSLMKEKYREAGITVAEGERCQSVEQAWEFVNRSGYPIIAKPDIGVGANQTYKINDNSDMQNFVSISNCTDYFLEQFVEGNIISFDGLTDREGNLVFYTAHQYSGGVMEAVNDDRDIYYYSYRDIPEDLTNASTALLKAFDIRERFFHLEFFRRPDGSLVGLEVNMRPPGGLTTDMFNYANDFDIYREWARLVTQNHFGAEWNRPYHVAYVGRKNNKNYRYKHADILKMFAEKIVSHESISGVFAPALGNYGYLLRTPDQEEILHMAAVIQEKV
ncbi:MAG TPA: ATP-grasp domain-containing protein [Candidatus Marinimicrobia bacterium]|nr:ATP-grasp domain-containing protein [Candidatus Neomarinimicrobiota bacterium]